MGQRIPLTHQTLLGLFSLFRFLFYPVYLVFFLLIWMTLSLCSFLSLRLRVCWFESIFFPLRFLSYKFCFPFTPWPLLAALWPPLHFGPLTWSLDLLNKEILNNPIVRPSILSLFFYSRTRDSRSCYVGRSVTKTKCERFFRYSAPAHPSATKGECIRPCFKWMKSTRQSSLNCELWNVVLLWQPR